MRRLIGRIVAAAPADTWFFLSVSAFAAVLTAAYWAWTYDWAGTVLLFGFAVATGVNGLRLLLAHPPRRTPEGRGAAGETHRDAGERADVASGGPGRVPSGETLRPGEPDVALAAADAALAPAAPDSDRPFLDETGRLPEPTIAPLAIALAVAFIATAVILGPWLLVAAVLPLAWGAIGWLRDAGAEYRATEEAHQPSDGIPRDHDMQAAALSGDRTTSGGLATAGRGLADRSEAPGDAPSRP